MRTQTARWTSLALLLLSATPAPAGETRAPPELAGLWVPAELRRALEADRPAPLPCYLAVELEPALRVVEDCDGTLHAWTGAAVARERAGIAEIRADDEARRLVHRAGTPGELERVAPGPDGEASWARLYRLRPELEARLRSWGAARRLLRGAWSTGDGATLAFLPDGTYRFAHEAGRYRFEPGAGPPGTVGLLVLEPAEDAARRYLVTGGGRRIGLVAAPQELPARPPGQEAGVAPSAAGAGGGSAAAEPAAAADPPALEPTLRLTRTELPQQSAPPPRREAPAPPPDGEVPIRRPIEPAGRCGCASAEASLALAPLVALLLASRRRRAHDPGA